MACLVMTKKHLAIWLILITNEVIQPLTVFGKTFFQKFFISPKRRHNVKNTGAFWRYTRWFPWFERHQGSIRRMAFQIPGHIWRRIRWTFTSETTFTLNQTRVDRLGPTKRISWITDRICGFKLTSYDTTFKRTLISWRIKTGGRFWAHTETILAEKMTMIVC